MSEAQERYDTQELLSMSMDRLKQYMEKFESGPGPSSKPDPDRARSAHRKRRITQAIRLEKRPKILLVRPDPIHLSRIISENDRLLPNDRFSLTWGESYASSLEKMAQIRFKALAVFDDAETIEGVDCPVEGIDFLLILNGLMARDDDNFLLKKQLFVKHFVPGDTDAEKVAHFRLLKEEYAQRRFVFVFDPGRPRSGEIASRIHGVAPIPLDGFRPEGFFATLKTM